MRKFSINKQFRKGAASFYIVAISTLILVIIAASFAAVIVSEVTRTSNDDLSQSAYDSALAGVEDAKLAFYNYQDCKNKIVNKEAGAETSTVANMTNLTCGDLVKAVEDPQNYDNNDDGDPNNCDLVAKALGRKVEESNGEKLGVLVKEGTSEDSENEMQQYYSCVKISAVTDDYLGKLDSEDPEHSVRIRFKDANGNGVVDETDGAKYVRLSWHSRDDSDTTRVSSANTLWYYPMTANNNGVFGKKKSTPSVVSLTMIQTAPTFSLSDFDMSVDGATNRGTLYFVPVDSCSVGSDYDNYICKSGDAATAANGDGSNTITNDVGFAKSNDKTIKNKPFAVQCDKEFTDYACSVLVEIPMPVANGGGGAATNRNTETFVFSVGLPYGEPKTSYELEFLNGSYETLQLDGVQVSIDSTGRANDLFRRVDTRLEPADAAYPYPIYGIEALDPNGNPGIVKNFDTTCEYNFDDQTCR